MEMLLLAVDVVLEAPRPMTGPRDEQIKTIAV